MSNNRVYVGNLAYSVNNVDLKNFMLEAGDVVRATVLYNHSRQSRGCGIVEFSTVEEAQKAIDTLNNVELKGRMVFVREDREPPRAAKQDGAFAGVAEGDNASASTASGAGETGTAGAIGSTRPAPRSKVQPGTAIFVSNLPFSVTWYELKDLFAQAGEVVRADVHMVHHRSKGHGTVVFTSEAGAESAIQTFNNYVLDGRTLEVRLDVPLAHRPGAFLWCSGFGEPSDTVFVSNLPWSTTDADLFDLFQSIAPLTRAQLQTFQDGRQSGNGVVKFENEASAALAVEQLNGYNYGSRPLHVSYARYQPLS